MYIKDYFLSLSFLLLVYSCITPEKALERGQYSKAIELANKQILRGKHLEENRAIIATAIPYKIQEFRQENLSLLKDGGLQNKMRVSERYTDIVQMLNGANLQTSGMLSDELDALEGEKRELDQHIARDWYIQGSRKMASLRRTESKETAREAYNRFSQSERFGGGDLFDDPDKQKRIAYEEDVIQYVSDNPLLHPEGLFVKALPKDAGFEPDCVLKVSRSFVDFDESICENEENYETKIEVDTRSETDSSGEEILIPIYETVNATVIKRSITVTASKEMSIIAKDLTGHCFLKDKYYDVSSTDSYIEIEVEGDERAIPDPPDECSGPPVFFEDNLEEELDDLLDDYLKQY